MNNKEKVLFAIAFVWFSIKRIWGFFSSLVTIIFMPFMSVCLTVFLIGFILAAHPENETSEIIDVFNEVDANLTTKFPSDTNSGLIEMAIEDLRSGTFKLSVGFGELGAGLLRGDST